MIGQSVLQSDWDPKLQTSCAPLPSLHAALRVAARLLYHYLQFTEPGGVSFGLGACPFHRGVPAASQLGRGAEARPGIQLATLTGVELRSGANPMPYS